MERDSMLSHGSAFLLQETINQSNIYIFFEISMKYWGLNALKRHLGHIYFFYRTFIIYWNEQPNLNASVFFFLFMCRRINKHHNLTSLVWYFYLREAASLPDTNKFEITHSFTALSLFYCLKSERKGLLL